MSTLNEQDRANLAAFLDGELDEDAAQALEAKLSQDADARKEVDQLRQAWNMLDYLPHAEPSPNFTNRTLERLTLAAPRVHVTSTMISRRPRWYRGFAWVAAVLLALVIGVGAGRFFWPGTTSGTDDPLASHPRVADRDNFRVFELVDDIDFLKSLDQPELFGEETGA